MSKGDLQAVAQQGDYCELWNRSPFAFQSSPAACTAGTGRFLRRKIPFSKAKIASLQFPRPEIRRISAETGEGGSGGGAGSPVHQGLTQLSLQMQTGIEQSLISKYKSGERVPPTETLMLLADFFHTSMDYIMERTEERKPYPRTGGAEPPMR